MVDGVTEGEVRSETGKRGFFINMTTVLPASGRVGLRTDTFRGQRSVPSTSQGCQEEQNGGTAA